MKHIITGLLLFTLLALPAATAAQNQTPPQRELRSAWVATVWRLDWPQTVISSTGNESQIQQQQEQMTALLDSLSLNNFNAINFQVRSRSDAMYNSSYEPWSSDLVSTRGMDPGWDPLEWVIAECHRRGMECHAWVNPYRVESVAHQWDGTPRNYRDTHPDWLIDVTNDGSTSTILNPGKPEVTQRICDIIKEIVQNYDVDGILFDDYFYLSGTNESHDGDLWQAYRDAGGTLDIHDWRRANVNNMVASVYATIKAEKPWVRFGISPAGIACTDASVAASYGIPPCPTGSDWQYNDIYSDPIAWISQRNLDFISPQVYWTIGNSTSYNGATRWWSEVAHKWNRHVFISHSISSLTGSSKSPQADGDTQYASGPGSKTFQEYADQVELNRQYNLDDAPGSIFYSAKYLYRTARTFSHFLRNKVFTTHCLPPSMPWISAAVPDAVENVSLSGNKLSWTEMDGMRYTVYAFPQSFSDNEKVRQPEYLLGVSYINEFALTDKQLSGYSFGVCAYDRFGNESPLALPGGISGTLPAPALKEPADGDTAELPFDFSWEPVDGAAEYIVELGSDASMTSILETCSTTSTSMASDRFSQLTNNTPLYWRVRAICPGKADGTSPASAFNTTELRITSPADGITMETLQPTFTYNLANREVTLEISTDRQFDSRHIVYTNTHSGSHTVAQYALMGAVKYYARARYTRAGQELSTPIVEFTTPAIEPSVPAIAVPVAGADFHSDSRIQLVPTEGPSILRVEVSGTTDFPVRGSYISSKVDTRTMTDVKTGAEIKLAGKHLVDGQTYYCRARATFRTADGSSVQTDFCAPVPFVYRAAPLSGINNATGATAIRVDGATIIAGTELTNVCVFNTAGMEVLRHGNMHAGQTAKLNLPAGVYIISADGLENIKTIIR